MQNKAQEILSRNIPYNIDTLFTQICLYKCFEVNLLRALFATDKSLKKIKLINAYWFDKWKKISCYQAIRHELNMNCSIQDNFKFNINNYYKIVESINIEEQLDNNIENDYIISEYDKTMNRVCVDHESEFEIISNELWDCFLQQSNTNQLNIGTSVELDLEYLTNDSLIIHLNDEASYIIFWNKEKERLGKYIFVFSDNTERDCVIQGIKHSFESFIIFYNNFLGDLLDIKDINYLNCSFKCINKTEKKILNYDDFKNYKRPVGLVNVRLTCYMNSALQGLFYVPKLTNYLLKETNAIKNMQGYHSFLKEYLNVVVNLSRKAAGSKLKEAYSPKEFFKIIENESEFHDLAGDSIDMVRFTLEKLHSELSSLPNDEMIFSKYLGNNNSTIIVFGQQMLKLNAFINNYSSNNNSIISNTFYFIEKTVMTCRNCKKTVSIDFNCQMYTIFPLKDIQNEKIINNFKKTPIYQQLFSNNNSINSGTKNNNNNNFNNFGMTVDNNCNFNNLGVYQNNNNNMNNQNIFNPEINPINNYNMNNQNNNLNMNNQTNNLNMNNQINNLKMNNQNNNINMNNQNNNINMNYQNNNINMNNQNNNINMNNQNNNININNQNNNINMNNQNNNINMNYQNNNINMNYQNNNININNQNNINMNNQSNNININNQNNLNMNNQNNLNNNNQYNNFNINNQTNNLNMNNQNNINMNNLNNNLNMINQNSFNNFGMYPNNNYNFNDNNFSNPNIVLNNFNSKNPTNYEMFQKNMIFKNEFQNYVKTNRNLTIKLMDCFEYVRNKEVIINELTCESCKMQVSVTSKTTYYNLPDVLIINFSREKDNKFDVPVSFEESIDLNKEVESKIDKNIYDLICIIAHFGKSGTEGHYMAYCKIQEKNKWYQFNDSVVTESSFQEASTSGRAYILFYQRKQN